MTLFKKLISKIHSRFLLCNKNIVAQNKKNCFFSVKSSFILNGKIRLGSCTVEDNSLLSASSNDSTISLGHDVYINRNCTIVAREHIEIGDGVMLGPGVTIYDHDHEYKNLRLIRDSFVTKAVFIGEGTWIGANATILKGVSIGKRCVIAAGTMISSGTFPDDSLIYSEKKTVVKRIER